MGSHDLLILLSRTSQVQDGQKINDSLKACLINFDFEKFIRNYATTKSMFSTTSNVEVENQRCLSKFFVIWTISLEFICDVMKDLSKSVIEWWMVVQFGRGTHPSKTFRLYLHLSWLWTISPAGNPVTLWMLPIVPIRDHHISSRKFTMSK